MVVIKLKGGVDTAKDPQCREDRLSSSSSIPQNNAHAVVTEGPAGDDVFRSAVSSVTEEDDNVVQAEHEEEEARDASTSTSHAPSNEKHSNVNNREGYVMVDYPDSSSLASPPPASCSSSQGIPDLISPPPAATTSSRGGGGENHADIRKEQSSDSALHSHAIVPGTATCMEDDGSIGEELRRKKNNNTPLAGDPPSSSTSTLITSTAPSSSSSTKKAPPPIRPRGPSSVMTKRIPVEDGWRERLPLVMLQAKPDGSNTPIAIIKTLSSALTIEVTGDGNYIEIKAHEWQELKEADALLRLTFRDYDGVSVWWFYTIPSFVSTVISGTTGTDVPEFSNPAVGLKCSIAPYDENSTRRAFFLTCPEWEPLNNAYQKIRRAWNYWRYQSVERQIDGALGVLYQVMIDSIKADGNCLFRAFAKSMLGDEERHMEIREAVVDFMRRSEELKGFIVSDDENDDTAAFAERYLEEMEKNGTWGDQVEITAFTRVYCRAVRVFSYNYSESRLVSVVTPLEEGMEAKGSEVWLLHLHGHYSLLTHGVAPKDAGWERMLREIEEAKGYMPLQVGEREPEGEGRKKKRNDDSGSNSTTTATIQAEEGVGRQLTTTTATTDDLITERSPSPYSDVGEDVQDPLFQIN